MGCDIHGWVEHKVGDRWIAVAKLKDRNRNYRRFALLAKVRDYHGEGKKDPLGIPSDVSETAGYDIEQWGADGHSHSYMPLKDACEIFNETACEKSEWPEDTFFDQEEEDVGKARLVFWFDN